MVLPLIPLLLCRILLNTSVVIVLSSQDFILILIETAMAQNQQRSLKVRLFNSIGLQSQSDVPSRSLSLPTLNATSKLPRVNETSKCYVKPGSTKRRPMSSTTKRGWLRKQCGLLMRSWQVMLGVRCWYSYRFANCYICIL